MLNNTNKNLVALLTVALILVGCAPTRLSTPIEDSREFFDKAAQQKPAPETPPPEVESALLPRVQVEAAPKVEAVAERFDISVTEVPAREFFMGLVEGTDYNMVVHPGVDGTITLNLKRVTIPDVMDIASDVYGYEFERTAYGFQVMPARLRSKLFHINYINFLRSGASQTRVSSGQITQIQGGEDGEILSDTSEFGSSEQSRRLVTGTEINTTQPETTFWIEVETSIKAILGGAPGRSVVVNAQSGVIVVRAMPHELREVEAFLRATENVVVRQVILETKILEVELSDAHQTGINWDVLVKKNGDEYGVSISPFGILGPTDIDELAGPSIARPFGGLYNLTLDTNDVTAVLDLLETQGSVQVLSSPRVSTLNNQKAVIKVGSDEYFVTDISSTTVTGTATTTSPNVELTPFFSGIALDVTPQISHDGIVTLHVHPSVSEVDEQRKTISVGTSTSDELEVPLAFSTVRESDSVVRARSGQIVVIGGLMKNEVSDDRSAPVLLGDVPGINRLFRNERGASSKSELVILLRPIVVTDATVWGQAINDSRELVDRLEGGIKQYQTDKWPWQ